MASPYTGVRVLDLTNGTGMYAGKFLAGLGMDIIKAEPVKTGCPERGYAPFFHGEQSVENSLFFAYHNTGKKSVALDLDCKEGRELLGRLIASVDVLLDSHPAGWLEDKGFSFNHMQVLNPGLIYGSLTAFGLHGPYRSWAASSELMANAAGGQMFEIGLPNRAPLQFGFNLVSNICCLYLAFGVQAALRRRRLTGEGAEVDISMQTCVAAWRCTPYGAYQRDNSTLPTRVGPTAPFRPSGVYRCSDGMVIMNPLNWGNMIDWMKETGHDVKQYDTPKYLEGPPGHNRNFWNESDEINRFIESFTVKFRAAELMEEAQRRKIPAGAIQKCGDMLTDRHLEERAYFQAVEHPVHGIYRYPGAPFKMSGSPYVANLRAPILGEHTQEVLFGIGVTPAQFAEYKAKGVI